MKTIAKSLNLLLAGYSHLYRLTNEQVSYGLCCQNTIEQVSDSIQRINRINVSLSIERPYQTDRINNFESQIKKLMSKLLKHSNQETFLSNLELLAKL